MYNCTKRENLHIIANNIINDKLISSETAATTHKVQIKIFYNFFSNITEVAFAIISWLFQAYKQINAKIAIIDKKYLWLIIEKWAAIQKQILVYLNLFTNCDVL